MDRETEAQRVKLPAPEDYGSLQLLSRYMSILGTVLSTSCVFSHLRKIHRHYGQIAIYLDEGKENQRKRELLKLM